MTETKFVTERERLQDNELRALRQIIESLKGKCGELETLIRWQRKKINVTELIEESSCEPTQPPPSCW